MATKKQAMQTNNGNGTGGVSTNEVRLLGTLSGAPETRVLPSGDVLGICRLVVRRDSVRSRADGRPGPRVDVVDCAAWDARPRRSMAGWSAGDEIEVRGALRRRFFRAGGQVASRVEVEVSSGRIIRRAKSG